MKKVWKYVIVLAVVSVVLNMSAVLGQVDMKHRQAGGPHVDEVIQEDPRRDAGGTPYTVSTYLRHVWGDTVIAKTTTGTIEYDPPLEYFAVLNVGPAHALLWFNDAPDTNPVVVLNNRGSFEIDRRASIDSIQYDTPADSAVLYVIYGWYER